VGLSGVVKAQQSYTFTSAGVTGPTGPTQGQLNTAYLSTNLNGSVVATGGIQTFTIPSTGPYRIRAIGGQGGYNGGFGSSMSGDYTLTAGTVLKILIGQAGTQLGNGSYVAGGGGGGSFVSSLANVPYVVAGGGGGAGDGYIGGAVNNTIVGISAALITTGYAFPFPTGGVNGGSGGNGGTCAPSLPAGSGAGIFGNGNVCSSGSAPLSYTNGGAGGTGTSGGSGDGGFGGGAGGYSSGVGNRGGGGGGYSGGGGGTAVSSEPQSPGGGGGSFNSGVNQVNAISTSTGNGRVIIDLLCDIKITSSGTSSVNPAICSGNSVTLTTNAVSNYTWSNGNSTSTTIVVSPSSSQTYSIIGTSSLACISAASISVTVNGALPALTITNTPNTICLGKSATLTAGGALSYTWAGGSGSVTNGQSFIPTATANYTVTGQNGCGTSQSVTAITIAPFVVTAGANFSTVCAGSTTTLTANAAVNGFTWMPSGVTGSTAILAPFVNTVYTVSASDGTCFGVATVTVNTKGTPTLSIVASNSLICEGAIVTMTASGALSYTWSPTNTNGATLSDTPLIPTSYIVAGTNSNNCVSQISQIVITQTAPVVVIAATKTIVCTGSSATLTASGANSYNWLSGPSTAVNVVNPTTASIYTVTGAGSNGCGATQTITVNVLASNVLVSTPAASICSGGSTTLSATGANTYVWTGVGSSNGNAVVFPTTTTIYTVTATTTIPGLNCQSSNTITITVFNNPTVTIVATKSIVCKNDANVVLTGNGAITYTWSTTTVSTSISVHPQSTTTYTVSGKDANGCESVGSKIITVNSCNGIGELVGIDKGILVYPNPSNGVFEITSNSEMSLRLINELGQEIRTIKLSSENDYKVSVSDLSNGVYFVVGQNGTGKINQKIVVNN